MLACIKVQQNIQCEYICHQLQLALAKYQKNNPDIKDLYITVDIRTVKDDDSLIPKLEHKTSPS